MIRLNTDQMRKRLSESYEFIYAIEKSAEEKQEKHLDDRTKNSQVSNG